VNIILYIIIFAVGALLGTLIYEAAYRVPLKRKILKGKMKCHRCGHVMETKECIPIVSYFLTKGKCLHCHKGVGFQKLIIELSMAIVMVIATMAMNITTQTITVARVIELLVWALYFVFLYVVCLNDVENHKIENKTISYGIIVAVIEIVAQYISCLQDNVEFNINRIIIYLIIIAILLLINIMQMKKNRKREYPINLLITCAIMCIFTYEISVILSIISTLLIVFAISIIRSICKKKKQKYMQSDPENMTIAMYLAISNMIIVLTSMIIAI